MQGRAESIPRALRSLFAELHNPSAQNDIRHDISSRAAKVRRTLEIAGLGNGLDIDDRVSSHFQCAILKGNDRREKRDLARCLVGLAECVRPFVGLELSEIATRLSVPWNSSVRML